MRGLAGATALGLAGLAGAGACAGPVSERSPAAAAASSAAPAASSAAPAAATTSAATPFLPASSAPVVASVAPPAASSAPAVCAPFLLPALTPVAGSACTRDDDCVLAPDSCCGACGELGLDHTRAIARDRPNPFCAAQTGCPRCLGTLSPHLKPVCFARRCRVQAACEACTPRPRLLARKPDEGSRCKTDDDCTLGSRTCCWCGEQSEANLRAISRKDAPSHPCGGTKGCPDCMAEMGAFAPRCAAGTCRAVALDRPAGCPGSP